MTTVVICKDKDGLYKGFYCMGHALFAEEGEPDILCAAVSALTIATINGLEELAGQKLSAVSNNESGFLKCDFHSILQEKSVFLMDTMVLALETLSREYGTQFLQVNFKEV